MNRKYKLDKKRRKRRIKRILLTYGVRISFGLGVVCCFNSVLSYINKKLELPIESEDMDYSFLDLEEYNGSNFEEKYIDFRKNQDKYINMAINYFNSEEYYRDLINDDVYYNEVVPENYESERSLAFKKIDLVQDPRNQIAKNENDNKTFEEEVIRHYCNIYEVDFDKVYKYLAELTDNFSSNDYLNGTIPGITFKGEDATFSNVEALLLVAVRCCAQKNSEMGLNDIKTGIRYESSFTREQEIVYYSNVFGVDPSLTFGIINAEGNKTNNVGSIKINGKFASYENETMGIIEMIAEIYKFVQRGLDTPEKMQPIYAPMSDGEINGNWVGNVADGILKADVLLSNLDKMDLAFEDYPKVVNTMHR